MYYPNGTLPRDCENWDSDAFGRVYADMQVHNMQRGFIYALTNPATNKPVPGIEKLIFRYRMEYRLSCADRSLPPAWGVTHATDQYIWFWGNGEVIKEAEKGLIKKAVVDPFVKFVHGEDDLKWGTQSYKEMRTLKPDGSVGIWKDEIWDEGVRVWKILREVGEYSDGGSSRL
jgi:hypothetical protein